MDKVRAAKLIRMLSSSNEGEVLNAARLLTRMDIYAVAEAVEGGGWSNEVALLSGEIERLQAQLAAIAPRHCVVCGEVFAGRRDAVTCSPRCRVRLHRQRRR
jgi:hypothetical protein